MASPSEESGENTGTDFSLSHGHEGSRQSLGETLTALFKTSFRQDFPFDPAELFAFVIIGVVCGFAGALFVFTHRKFVEFIRKQKRVTNFLQRNRFIFPSVVVFLLSSVSFPPGLGQYMAGMLTNHAAVNELFSNFTWSAAEAETVEQKVILDHWMGPLNNIYITLLLFVIMRFWMSALATTLPVPAGVFMPVFTLGAAFGRLMGESMAVWFPDGFNGNKVLPGGYAIVGAAALSGSVTHTISTSVIVFELTGQMGHVLPCVISVLVSNAIAHVLQPSFYDSLIQLKKLPFLPDIINRDAVNAHRVFVEDFMVKQVKALSVDSTYFDASQLLTQNKFRSFPLVESKQSMMLLGSIQRSELERLVQAQIQEDKMWDFFLKRHLDTGEFDTGPGSGDAPDSHQRAAGEASEEAHLKSALKKTDSKSTFSQSQGERGRVHFKNPATSFKLEITPQQQLAWENQQLRHIINYDECQIDPAPFQLVERTSLYKVHSMFSLLGIHHAYVTTTGRLVGLVGLAEVRNAVQGHVTPTSKPPSEKPSLRVTYSEDDGVQMEDVTSSSHA